MAKIISIVFLLIASGCQESGKIITYEKFQTQEYNLVFGSNLLDIQFNLKNDSLTAHWSGSGVFYKDTMHLTKGEKDEITTSFFEQNIDECRGDINIDGKRWEFPRVDDLIQVYKQDKKIATISVLRGYEPDGMFIDKKERGIIKFRDLVWEILCSQSKYKVAKDSLRSVMIKGPPLL